MLVFSTRLPIRAEVTQQECLELFLEWLNGSPYYPTDEICFDVNSHDDYDYTKGVVSLKRGNSFLVQKKHSDYENPNACGRM